MERQTLRSDTLAARRLSKMISILTVTGVALVGCDGDPGPAITDPANGTSFAEYGIVVNSVDVSITVFPVDSPQSARNIGLAPAGTPVSAAASGPLVAIPLGQVSALAVYDLSQDRVATIALPQNSGASGVAFVTDSIVYVANSNLNTVSVVDVAGGIVERDIPVGVFPQSIAVQQERVFVLNGELDQNFQPARRGTITVIDPTTHTVIDTVQLTGFNPTAATRRFDGMLYVVNSGTFGQGDGSVSVVSPSALSEAAHYADFGEFPGDIAFDPFGVAYVSSFAYGIAVWDPDSGTFVNPPSTPLIIDGHTISSGLGFDGPGRLYTLIPGDCISPGVALRTLPGADLVQEIVVGVCPIDLTFTTIERR